MQVPTTNPAPVRAPCPPPQPASFLGWLGGLLGLSAPAYRGVGQPRSSGGVVFGQAPGYRLPRSRGSTNGPTVLTEPVLLDGPVTIVVGARE